MISRLHRPTRGLRGFTLIELMVTISLASIVMGLIVLGFRGFAAASDESGTAQQMVASLRNAQVRALTEGKNFCARFVAPTTWKVYRGNCSTGAQVASFKAAGSSVSFAAPAFRQRDNTTSADLIMYANGTATPGSVIISRTGSPKQYTVTVEEVTGRVAFT